jgi:LEA14-like dessication related protein
MGRHKKAVAVVFVIIMIAIPLMMTIREPDATVWGFRIISSGTGLHKSFQLIADVQVYNPNIVSVTVLRVSGSFYVNSEYGGDFLREDPVEIKADDYTHMDIQVMLKSSVPVSITGTNQIEAKGTATIKGLFGSWDIPFNEETTVSVS